jgi:hypothetical protein
MIINRQEEGDLPSLTILGWKVETPAPTGAYIARCLDVSTDDKFRRKKWQSEEIEEIPAIRFLFGIKKGDQAYLVQTKVYKASGSPKSALYKLITGWTGAFPGEFNPRDMIGKIANINVEQMTSNNGTVYGAVMNVAGAPEGMEGHAPTSAECNTLMIQAGADVGTLPQAPADPTLPKPTPQVQQAIEPKEDNGEAPKEVPF